MKNRVARNWVPLTVGAGSLVAGTAFATPRALPFTYTYETLGTGDAAVEQYVDMVPVRVFTAQGSPIWALAAQLQTEFAYGVTDHVELGLYATVAPTPNSNAFPQSTPSLTEGNGAKQRLRLRLFDEGTSPVDIDLAGELVENESEIGIEARLVLQKRFGNLRLAGNFVAAEEFRFAAAERDTVFQPSVGVTYQVTPVFHPGVEGWMWAELTNLPAGGTTSFNDRPNVYVGPTVLLHFGRLWWSTGAYVRVTNIDHVVQPAVDAFGPFWFRAIVGVGF